MIQYGPIIRWPGRLRADWERKPAPFKSGLTSTLKLLERELVQIHAQSVVVQLAIEPRYFTSDGRPYAKARATHPGVVVSFSKPITLPGEKQPRKVPLSFPADRFRSWESNLRAIALGLEDLRRIERYGITQTSEQYTGFKALPGPLHHMPTMTIDEAAAFVAGEAAPLVGHITDPDLRVKARGAGSSAVLRSPEMYDQLYRLAAKRLHPDVSKGQTEKWQRLAEAKQLLDGLHYPAAGGGATIIGG